MSDLREALDWYENDEAALPWSEPPEGRVLAAAARRFLALTETGPDYEAAARALFARRYGSDESFGGLAKDDVYRKMARAAVDAALADYLTEEDR